MSKEKVKSKTGKVNGEPIKSMFKGYSTLFYPEGMPPEQYRQIQDAFFAGAASVQNLICHIYPKELSEKDMHTMLTILDKEVSEFGAYLDRKAGVR